MRFYLRLVLFILNMLAIGVPAYCGLMFDGISDSVKVSNNNIIKGLEGVTVSLWVKGTRSGNILTSQSLILHFYDGLGFHLKSSDGTSSGYVYWEKGIASCDNWQHLVATWSNKKTGDGKMRLYANGIMQCTELEFAGGKNGSLAGGILNLGGKFNPWIAGFNGQMEDMRIYNRALTHSEILSIFVQRGGDKICKGLILRWDMNNPEKIIDTKIQDISGNDKYGIMAKRQLFNPDGIANDSQLEKDIAQALNVLTQDQEKCKKKIAALEQIFTEEPLQTAEFLPEFNEIKQRHEELKKEHFYSTRKIYKDSLILEARIGLKILRIK